MNRIIHNKKENEVKDHSWSDEAMWILTSAVNPTLHFDEEEAYRKFEKHLNLVNRRQRFSLYLKYSAAAVVFILAGSLIATSYFSLSGKLHNETPSAAIVDVPYGAKTKIRLPDGSVVWLNAGSHMVYSQNFGVTHRNLELKGEGYFEVKKNKELPFTIHTEELNVQVLGTKFNFRNYSEDSAAEVNLIEGKVALSNKLIPGRVEYLLPEENMYMDKHTGAMSIMKNTKNKEEMGWINNVLFFNKKKLADIVLILQRTYNVEIIIANEELKSDRFYGVFNQHTQSIDEILSIFSETNRLHYEKLNDVFYITKK